MYLPAYLFISCVVINVFMCNRYQVSSLQFRDNGYELLVAIHRTVPENLNIIPELQEMLTSASDYLYVTTRKYLYIRHVTILVPDTWERNTVWRLEREITFNEADIRVDFPYSEERNIPYTFQPGQCGEPGRYIHLTPDFVLDKISRDKNYRDAGRVLVHEFAHLRFGVFDEYGVRGSLEHPVYYIDDDSTDLKPTACTHQIKGVFVDVINDRSCESVDETKPLSENCDFHLNEFETKATASVMFAQFLDKVTEFCESDPDNVNLKHNADAPNMHNKMCPGRGTWDVLREHLDVKTSNPDAIGARTPSFDIAQRQINNNDTRVCGRRLVLVLDVSKSMVLNQTLRYFRLRQMADRTIRDILPVGTEVGIVVFASSARVWSDMTFLSTTSERERLAQNLPKYGDFDGTTAIGQGLLRAIQLLKKNRASAEKGRLFLITDGMEVIPPFVKDVMSDIISENVVVHTVAYSDSAADVLRQLSTSTGGQYSFFDETTTSSALEGAAERLLSDISLCHDEDSIQIDRHAVQLTPTMTTFERSVLIDSTVGNNTLFVFTITKDATTEITLEDPSGTVLGAGSSYYSKDGTLNIVRFLIPMAEVGVWRYKLKRGSAIAGGESVVGVVRSHPRGSVQPYEVDTWVSSTTFNYASGSGVVAYVYVHQGYAPILDARVEMTATRPGINASQLVLKDNGILPDNTANDGVYTTYLLGFLSNSRYSLEVKVVSVENETVILKSGNLLSGRTRTVYQNTSLQQEVREPVERFSRTASAGAIDITGLNSSVDQLDPGRVTDLDVSIHDKVNKSLNLTWTAPGDDLNLGTVAGYDLRLAKTFQDLQAKFTSARPVRKDDVIRGSLNPLPAGSRQTVIVRLPSNWSHDFYVLGLRAFDEANRISGISNLRSITFKSISIPQRSPKAINPTGNYILVIGIAIGGTVVLLVIVMVVLIICVRKRKTINKGTSST